MKKAVIGTLCLLLIFAAVVPLAAQGRRDRYYRGGYDGRTYDTTRYYGNRGYRNRGYDRRSWWDRHRDKTTVAIGTGAGAAIGGLAGGKRGAIIGALLGAGGSALYTYGLRDRNNRRYYRNNQNYYRTRRGYYR